jgi:DNA-binding IclR family transcriptional regulator
VQKVAMVMTAVAAGERPTVTEIARRTTLPVSTAHRLITQLDRYGLLVRAEDGTYRVPLRAPARAEGGAELVELAASVLEDLARVVDTSVRLVTRHGTEITSIARCLPGAPASAAAQRLPAHASAAGKVLLAHASTWVVDQVVRAGLPRLTTATITSPDVLRRSLAQVRLARLAISRGEHMPGQDAVAAPVTSAGQVVAALEVSARHLPGDLTVVRAALELSTNCLSRDLGREAGPVSWRHGRSRASDAS